MTIRAIAAALTLVLIAGGPALAETAPRTITVTGTGTASATPDRARFDVSAVVVEAEAQAAMASAAAVSDRAIAVLRGLGVAAEDMQTRDLSLFPRYAQASRSDDAAPRITGFEARAGLSVVVRELDRIGPILDGLLAEGINQIGGIAFEVGDPSAAEDAARRAAVADALAKATLYAEEIGAAVGPVLRLGEAGLSAPGPQMEMARVASLEIAPGAQEIRATVTVVYALERLD